MVAVHKTRSQARTQIYGVFVHWYKALERGLIRLEDSVAIVASYELRVIGFSGASRQAYLQYGTF